MNPFFESSPPWPIWLDSSVPKDGRQLIVVEAESETASTGRLWTLERASDGTWRSAGPSIPVQLGRHGLAWGMPGPESHGLRMKREGDGCSPVGVFDVPLAFGSDPQPERMKLPYLHCTEHHFGIDDVRSRHYNRIVDAREVTCDWTSPETMIPSNGCYRLGAVIGHNAACEPGMGSCIFFHVWQGPQTATSGCTAMRFEDVQQLLQWLDPDAKPRLVQFVRPK